MLNKVLVVERQAGNDERFWKIFYVSYQAKLLAGAGVVVHQLFDAQRDSFSSSIRQNEIESGIILAQIRAQIIRDGILVVRYEKRVQVTQQRW